MLQPDHQHLLLDLAQASIVHGLEHHEPLRPALEELPRAVGNRAATFVTLHLDGRLRGCIGELEASSELALSVATNAFRAAFRDPRFAPLSQHESAAITLHISVLGRPEPLTAASEAELLAQLEPGVHGLVLQSAHARATFLPSVWSQLPTGSEFLAHLKRKAGLAAQHWGPELRFLRYTVQEFGGSKARAAG